MKHLYYIAALAATFLTAMPLHAQEEVENEATQQQQTRRRSPQASRGERNVNTKPEASEKRSLRISMIRG